MIMKNRIYFNFSKSIRHQHPIIILLIALIFHGCGGSDKQIQQGKQLIEQGNYSEAILYLSEAIQKDESNAEAHYQLGRSYAFLKRHNKAVEEFQIALSFEPDRADISYELGKSLWRLGRRKPALSVFREVLQGEATQGQFEEILALTGEIHPTKQLTDSKRDSSAPAFSPDGNRIVFVRTFHRDNKIMMMDIDGGNEVNLSLEEGYSDSNPVFSPDGTKVVFSSRKAFSSQKARSEKEEINNAAIFIMDIDGGNRKLLYKSNADSLSPNFSTDGGTIIFEEKTPNGWEIVAVDSDGKNRRQLTDNHASDIRARFSLDGEQIVFSSDRDGNYEIYLMKADGSNQTRLTHNDATDLMPAFSPDETRRLSSYGDKTRRWRDRATPLPGQSHATIGDGDKIVFISDRDSNAEIYIMNADGSEQRRLTHHDDKDITPYFSPDGTKVIFSSVRDSSYMQIWTMDLTKKLTQKELLARIRKQLRR